MTGMIRIWHNFRTGEKEIFALPTTAEGFIDYLPQDEATRMAYLLRVEHRGMAPVDAYLAVLDVITGEQGPGVRDGEQG